MSWLTIGWFNLPTMAGDVLLWLVLEATAKQRIMQAGERFAARHFSKETP